MILGKSSKSTSNFLPVCTLWTSPFLQSVRMQFGVSAVSGSAALTILNTSLMVLILCNAMILPSFQGRQLSHTKSQKSSRNTHCLQRVSKRDFCAPIASPAKMRLKNGTIFGTLFGTLPIFREKKAKNPTENIEFYAFYDIIIWKICKTPHAIPVMHAKNEAILCLLRVSYGFDSRWGCHWWIRSRK